MRYMLLICSDDKIQIRPRRPRPRWRPSSRATALRRGAARQGQDGRGERLRPDSDASRVRLKAGQRQIMDGPFAETKEALGGFYLIECDTKEEAVEWAKKIPLREGGFVEVRPIWQM